MAEVTHFPRNNDWYRHGHLTQKGSIKASRAGVDVMLEQNFLLLKLEAARLLGARATGGHLVHHMERRY